MGTFWLTALQLASTAQQAVGQFQQGAAASAAGEYNAAVARQNAQAEAQAAATEAQQLDYSAQLAQEDADLALAASAFRARQSRLLTARRQGLNRVAIAASGVTLEGSPLAVLLENAYQGEQEAQLTLYQGQLQALAKRREAQQLAYQATVRRVTGQRSLVTGEQQARLAEFGGSTAYRAGIYSGLGTLAGGLGRFVGRKAAYTPGVASGSDPTYG